MLQPQLCRNLICREGSQLGGTEPSLGRRVRQADIQVGQRDVADQGDVSGWTGRRATRTRRRWEGKSATGNPSFYIRRVNWRTPNKVIGFSFHSPLMRKLIIRFVSLSDICFKQSVSGKISRLGDTVPSWWIIRSTPKSRPNNMGQMSVRPSVRQSVRPSTKSFSDSDEIWFVGRGRWVMHDGMPYDPIQGQGHETFKVRNSSIFKILTPPPFLIWAGKWPLILKLRNNI